METTSIRVCQREGCENDLDALGLKATAKCCSPTCRREHSRAQGDGKPAQRWIKGHWRTSKPKAPRRRPAPFSARGSRHHSLGLDSTSFSRSSRHSAAREAR